MSTVLIIEDDPTTRLVLQTDLSREGYTIILAENGQEGLDKIRQFNPSVIICDWMMPMMSGLEVCKQAKSDPELSNIFFILLTAYDSLERRVEGIDAGADEFITKPFELEELRARVRLGVRQYQLKRLMKLGNEQLRKTLEELRHTQSQLIQSAKMSSLGKMVAGIAHEMNNPVNFLEGNITYTATGVQDLLQLMSLYQKYYPEPVSEIEEFIESIDLEFVSADLPNMLQSMQIGTQRISQIVNSLKRFSRLDEAELKLVNIHEGIDQALFLLQHRLMSPQGILVIQISQQYGDLPIVECFPGQLNQVFFNILGNAIDFLWIEIERRQLVLKDGFSDWIPLIEISTWVESDDQVAIASADNGPGMMEEVRQRIFDPFFTTRPVGRGIGMGLAVSYQMIVENHHGTLVCESALGEGSKFIISIPQTRDSQ